MDETKLLPFSFSRNFQILAEGSRKNDEPTKVWIGENSTLTALSEVSRKFGKIELMHLESGKLEQAIVQAYGTTNTDVVEIIGKYEEDEDLQRLMQDIPEVEDLLDSSDDAPIIRMINALLAQALQDGASDIHIEPFEQISSVRIRVDGDLREIAQANKAIHGALISRLKIMSSLNIAEKRLPQDGRITIRLGGRPIDVRLSTLPTGHGERAVLRLLEKDSTRRDLIELGMSETSLKQFEKIINHPHGIVLVTGPTGSGKTTTLYAALSNLNSNSTNILTVEDPIEYELPGVGQTQVNPAIDMTFAKALRAILRQDPDIIMIGEIRDLETAQIAVQASLTGHLVLATLHTNDSAAAVTRLIDMGIEPYLLSSSLIGIASQRLVRKLCQYCKEKKNQQWTAKGCSKCNGAGYQGRVGIYEIISLTEELKQGIHDGVNEAILRKTARDNGASSMVEDGKRWLESGVTTKAEILRVTHD